MFTALKGKNQVLEKPGFLWSKEIQTCVEPQELPEGSRKCCQIDKRMRADDPYILLYIQLLLVAEIDGFVDHLRRQKSIKSMGFIGLF